MPSPRSASVTLRSPSTSTKHPPSTPSFLGRSKFSSRARPSGSCGTAIVVPTPSCVVADYGVVLFRAHKEVLSFASPFSQAGLNGNWTETGRPLSMSSVITISQPPIVPGDKIYPNVPTAMTFAHVDPGLDPDELNIKVSESSGPKSSSRPPQLSGPERTTRRPMGPWQNHAAHATRPREWKAWKCFRGLRSVFSISSLIAVCFYNNTSVHIFPMASIHQFVRTLRTLIFWLFLVRVYVCAFLAMSIHIFPFLYISLMDALLHCRPNSCDRIHTNLAADAPKWNHDHHVEVHIRPKPWRK